MNIDQTFANSVLDHLIDVLDVPPSYYERAIERYRSLSEWLMRPESTLRAFGPAMTVQGSFRYGTVIRPLIAHEEFDLDLLAVLMGLSKSSISQADLKQRLGDEVRGYARRHSMAEPEEKRRCWRLGYVDDINFHMDICPGVPEDDVVKTRLRLALEIAGIEPSLADLAIAITCQQHASYHRVSSVWPSSNPEGLARWFESRMKLEGLTRAGLLVESRRYASIAQVPTYEWKTPLQRAIQILKRHRDVMFRDDVDGRPISMIITTLAARAYEGESELYSALDGILDRMLLHLRPNAPRVPNPVNPAEDFADKWASNPKLAMNFLLWHKQARIDLDAIGRLDDADRLQRFIKKVFAERVGDDRSGNLMSTRRFTTHAPSIIIPSVTIAAAPRPWAERSPRDGRRQLGAR